jgi:hypothetical protein
MHISRAQIAVVMMMARMTVIVMIVAQQPGTHDIDAKAKRRNGDGLAEMDFDRRRKPEQTFVGNRNGNNGEQDRAGETREFAKLAGSECKTWIVAVTPRVVICERCNRKRRGMRRHVPSVGDQRERAEYVTADDLPDHHDGRQAYHHPGSPLIAPVPRPQEYVVVRPLIQRVSMHGSNPRFDSLP